MSSFLTRHEAAKLLRISLRKLDGLRKAGKLPSVKLDGRRLYDAQTLHRVVVERFGTAPAEVR